MTGTVMNIDDYGSIVVLDVETEDRGIITVPFDHRAFRWLLDGEQCAVDDLIGRCVSYDGERLEFVDV